MYGCLFTCFTSRSVHIEDVSSLETDSFTKAPRRFTFKSWLSERYMERQCDQFCRCREGNSTVPFDWNQDELNERLRKEEISCYLCPRTEWKFEPPTASHMSEICFCFFWFVFFLNNFFIATTSIDIHIAVYTYSKIKSRKKSYKIFDFKSSYSTFYASYILLMQ